MRQIGEVGIRAGLEKPGLLKINFRCKYAKAVFSRMAVNKKMPPILRSIFLIL